MSIESAREALNEIVRTVHDEYCDPDDIPPCDHSELIDNLILEVQAAMPCYGDSDPDCHEEFTRVNGEKVPAKAECPSCKARQALKVTA